MSRPIVVRFEDEGFPCEDFLDGNKIECPMKAKWHEGETRMCGECGWKILYDDNGNFDDNGNELTNQN
jgi:hypothetical protein